MTNYLITHDPKSCYGCRACEKICPKKAIVMRPDSEGFLYPDWDEKLCIQCQRCVTACPYAHRTGQEPFAAYAFQSRDAENLQSCSSGGVFFAIADLFLKNGGYVAGCIFDKNFEAIHVVSNELKMVQAMMGSKYVQSDIGDTYSQTKALLAKGVPVFFTGTPCQIAGLNCFLNKKYEKLVTVDLICHGVPSPELLKQYIGEIEKDKGKVLELRFRNKKRNGWCSRGSVKYFRGNSVGCFTISPFNSSYYNLYYLNNSVSRISCYSCQYADIRRISDLTIGDYWGGDHVSCHINGKNGISAVLVNSEHGKRVLEQLKSNATIVEADLTHIIRENGNLTSPGEMPKARKDIYNEIAKIGYKAVVTRDCHFSVVLPFIKRLIPQFIKKIIKKVLP